MSNQGAKHTWVFEPDSRLLRFYATVWRADPAKADFCKLFWSVVLAPLAPVLWLLRGLLIGSFAILDRLWTPVSGRRRERNVELSKVSGLPSRIASVFTRPVPRRIGRGFVCGYLGAALLYTLGALVLEFVHDFHQAMFVIGIVCSTLIVVAALIGLAVLFGERGIWKRAGDGLRRFGRFMADGYRSVKSNTCPRIVVRAAEDARA